MSHLDSTNTEYRISDKKLKLKIPIILGESQAVQVAIRVLRVDQGKSCVEFSYNDAETKSAIVRTDRVIHFLSYRDADILKPFCDATFHEH